VRVWLGDIPSGGIISTIVGVLACVYLVENITSVGITGARGIGTPWAGSWSALAYALSTLSLSLVLTPRLGLPGVLIASGSGAILGAAVFFSLSVRARIGAFREIVAAWILPAACSAGVAAAVAAVVASGFPQHLPRFSAALAVLLCSGIYAPILVLMFRITHLVEQRDLSTMKAMLPRRLGRALDTPVIKKLVTSS
jgi:hypothetical protein